jgi:hypothetical protein
MLVVFGSGSNYEELAWISGRFLVLLAREAGGT